MIYGYFHIDTALRLLWYIFSPLHSALIVVKYVMSTIVIPVVSVNLVFTINVYSMLKCYLQLGPKIIRHPNACAILNSPNFVFHCNSCLDSINDISDSASNVITLSSIADNIDNIKTLIVDSNNIINM